MLKTKKSNLEFRRIQALSVCARAYPKLYLKLRQDSKLDQALAVGYRVIEELGQ